MTKPLRPIKAVLALWIALAMGLHSVFAFSYGDRIKSTTDGLSIHSSDYLSSTVIDHANTGDEGTVAGGPYYDSISGYNFYYVVWDIRAGGYSVQNYLSAAPQPDLAKYSDGLVNTSPHPGDTISPAITIQNLSCSGVGGSAGVFHVGWYFSTTTTFNGVTPFHESTVNGCSANSTVPLTQDILIDPATIPGTYYLGYKIDDENEQNECNENNNGIFYWTINVLPAPQPDLTRNTDSLNNTSPHPGDTVNASITIQNQSCTGGSASAGAFHVGWYFSSTSSFNGVAPFHETPVSGCNANGTVSPSQNITISSLTAPGTYYLGYKIDDSNEVTECTENNNGIFYWTINVVTLADLVPENISVSPSPALAGGSINVSYAIGNTGGTAAPPSHTKVQIKNSANVLLTEQTFPTAGISANSSTNETHGISLVGANPGTYYAYVIADNDSEVTQSDSNNDLSSGSAFTVQSVVAGGTWQPLLNPPPGPVNLMLLLPDGTIMAAHNDDSSTFYNEWYRLIPDVHGSYINGTWTILPPMNSTRLFYSSQILRNGQLFVAGGEYGTGGATAEIYDPVANAWAQITIPNNLINPANNSPNTGKAQGILDAESKVLPTGDILIAPIAPSLPNQTLIFNSVTKTWSAGPASIHWLAEAGWVRLPDDSFLVADPDSTSSERYIPSLNQWVNDSDIPVSLYATLSGYVGETGPAFLLPNGKAFFIGGSGHTAIYTPSGSSSPGTWVSGPDLPTDGIGEQLVAADAPGAMMPNGKILLALAPKPYVQNKFAIFPPPTSFYEYDPVANSFAQVNGPAALTDNVASYKALMLNLPDGNVLYSHCGSDLYVYQPGGADLATGKPSISGISQNADGSYHLIGRLLNGISQGAAYGDDEQMDSSYPLVRITDSNGSVFYERTYNWSSTSIMNGSAQMSTEFTNSSTLSPGAYSLFVVANGISSDAFPFTISPTKANQTISFSPLLSRAYGEPPFAISATASSGLPVGFNVLSGPATISSNLVNLTGVGAVTIRAFQNGDSSYNPAANVDQQFTVYTIPGINGTQFGQNFVVTWPTNVPNFTLESTTNLTDPNSWTPVSMTPIIIGSQYAITNNSPSNTRFFRLSK